MEGWAFINHLGACTGGRPCRTLLYSFSLPPICLATLVSELLCFMNIYIAMQSTASGWAQIAGQSHWQSVDGGLMAHCASSLCITLILHHFTNHIHTSSPLLTMHSNHIDIFSTEMGRLSFINTIILHYRPTFYKGLVLLFLCLLAISFLLFISSLCTLTVNLLYKDTRCL